MGKGSEYGLVEATHDDTGHLGMERYTIAGGGADGMDEVAGRGALGEEAGGAELRGSEDSLVVEVAAEDEHMGIKRLAGDFGEGVEAREARHEEVQEEDIGAVGQHLSDGGGAIGGLADDFQIVFQ